MQPINKKTCVDALYKLSFKGELVQLYARSDKQAIQRAIEHFRPSKRDRDQVKVHFVIDELAKEAS